MKRFPSFFELSLLVKVTNLEDEINTSIATVMHNTNNKTMVNYDLRTSHEICVNQIKNKQHKNCLNLKTFNLSFFFLLTLAFFIHFSRTKENSCHCYQTLFVPLYIIYIFVFPPFHSLGAIMCTEIICTEENCNI